MLKIAKERLIEKFELTDVQAQAIVDMRLRALTGLEREKLENEFSNLFIDYDYFNERTGALKMFTHIKENQIFFKTYFKLEDISISPIIQHNTEMAKKYYDNKYIDYHIEFFRAGLNAIIKKWLDNKRLKYKDSRLNNRNIQMLNNIGMKWDIDN